MGGNVGRDVFHFDLGGGADVGNDIIVDFEIGIDRMPRRWLACDLMF